LATGLVGGVVARATIGASDEVGKPDTPRSHASHQGCVSLRAGCARRAPVALALRSPMTASTLRRGPGPAYSRNSMVPPAAASLPYRYRLLNSSLPPGLVLDKGRLIHGVHSGGDYSFWVELGDENPPSASWCVGTRSSGSRSRSFPGSTSSRTHDPRSHFSRPALPGFQLSASAQRCSNLVVEVRCASARNDVGEQIGLRTHGGRRFHLRDQVTDGVAPFGDVHPQRGRGAEDHTGELRPPRSVGLVLQLVTGGRPALIGRSLKDGTPGRSDARHGHRSDRRQADGRGSIRSARKSRISSG
jgi:hypothetical protein